MAATPIDQLNSWLRGEISVAETYSRALDKLDDREHGAQIMRLQEIQRDHGTAAQELRTRIQMLGGDASDDSGAWGAWANTVQATANLLGDAAALKALKEGEEHGLKTYERRNDELDLQTQQLAMRFAARQREHIREIDALLRAA